MIWPRTTEPSRRRIVSAKTPALKPKVRTTARTARAPDLLFFIIPPGDFRTTKRIVKRTFTKPRHALASRRVACCRKGCPNRRRGLPPRRPPGPRGRKPYGERFVGLRLYHSTFLGYALTFQRG